MARRGRWPATGSASIRPPPSAAIARCAAAVSVADVAALPGDEHAARDEQRKRQLDELVEPPTARAVTAGQRSRWRGIAGELLRPDGRDGDPRGEPGRLDDGLEERAPSCRPTRRGPPARAAATAASGSPGKPPPLPRSRNASTRPLTRRRAARDSREAVDDVADRDRRRVADRGQVDRGVPGDQQADVVGDRSAGVGVEVRPSSRGPDRGRRRTRPASGGRSSTRVGSGSRGRSRHPSCRSCLSRAVRAPLPASSFIAPPVGSRSSVACPVRGRVSPCPSQAPVPE